MTGAASGIGRATALRLAAEGGRVIAARSRSDGADRDAGARREVRIGPALDSDVRSDDSVAGDCQRASRSSSAASMCWSTMPASKSSAMSLETEPEVWDEVMCRQPARHLSGIPRAPCRCCCVRRRQAGGAAIVHNASLDGAGLEPPAGRLLRLQGGRRLADAQHGARLCATGAARELRLPRHHPHADAGAAFRAAADARRSVSHDDPAAAGQISGAARGRGRGDRLSRLRRSAVRHWRRADHRRRSRLPHDPLRRRATAAGRSRCCSASASSCSCWYG